MAVILFWCLAAAQEAPERLPPAPISAEEAPAAAPTDLGEVATEGEESGEETQGEEGLDLQAAEGEGGDDSGLSEEEVQLWETPDRMSIQRAAAGTGRTAGERCLGSGLPGGSPHRSGARGGLPGSSSIGLDAPQVSPLGLSRPRPRSRVSRRCGSDPVGEPRASRRPALRPRLQRRRAGLRPAALKKAPPRRSRRARPQVFPR